MTLERIVYDAVISTLAPLLAYGFRCTPNGDDVMVEVGGVARFFTARCLYEAADPCGTVAESFSL